MFSHPRSSALVCRLPLREQTMVALAGSTGLRRSEMFALKWADICIRTMQIMVTKGVYRSRIGGTKTRASRRPLPLHPALLEVLGTWRAASHYRSAEDYLFPSLRLHGKQPLQPDMILKKIVRPALKEAGIHGKIIGWHSFRHSLATNLHSMGVDAKVASDLLRHSSIRVTLDIYTRAVSAEKRTASCRQFELLMGSVPSPVPSGSTPLLLNAVNSSPA